MAKKIKVLLISGVTNNSAFSHPLKYLANDIHLEELLIHRGHYDPTWYRLCSTLVHTIKILHKINSYDVVVSTSVIDGFFLVLFQTLLSKKIIKPKHILIDVALLRVISERNKLLLKICKFIFSSVDVILFYATSHKKFWEKLVGFNGICEFIPLWTDITVFTSEKQKEKYILSCGRVGRDYKIFLEAVKDIPIDIVIVASYKDKKIFENYTKLSSRLRVYIDIPFDEYRKILQEALFVVLPFFDLPYDYGQTVLVQTMASGKAVIATKVQGTVDYIDDYQTGIFCKPADIEDLKEKILYLMNNPDEIDRIGKNAREKAIREFSEEGVSKKLNNIIHRIYEKNLRK